MEGASRFVWLGLVTPTCPRVAIETELQKLEEARLWTLASLEF